MTLVFLRLLAAALLFAALAEAPAFAQADPLPRTPSGKLVRRELSAQ